MKSTCETVVGWKLLAWTNKINVILNAHSKLFTDTELRVKALKWKTNHVALKANMKSKLSVKEKARMKKNLSLCINIVFIYNKNYIYIYNYQLRKEAYVCLLSVCIYLFFLYVYIYIHQHIYIHQYISTDNFAVLHFYTGIPLGFQQQACWLPSLRQSRRGSQLCYIWTTQNILFVAMPLSNKGVRNIIQATPSSIKFCPLYLHISQEISYHLFTL